MSNIKQYYDIKFPFTTNNLDGFLIDLNNTISDKAASEIAHVLLTSKGTRLRKPDFGTDLIKYIFEDNEEYVWDEVKREAIDSVNKYVPNTSLNDINIITNDEHSLFLELIYSVQVGKTEENKKMLLKL